MAAWEKEGEWLWDSLATIGVSPTADSVRVLAEMTILSSVHLRSRFVFQRLSRLFPQEL